MLRPATLTASPAVTSLPELPVGSTPCISRAGRKVGPSGREAAPASHSHAQAKGKAKKTPGTCGPSSDALSPTVILQRSLANKLRLRLVVNGSPEYVLTWKNWDMQSGPPICALRARARRTSDNAFTGWPTPNIPNRGCEMSKAGRPRSGGIDLQSTAQLAEWATCSARDWKSETATNEFHTKRAEQTRGKPLSWEALGVTTGPSDAGTTKPAAFRLNPHFSRWLMGFPVEWFNSVDWVTLSSRKLRRRS